MNKALNHGLAGKGARPGMAQAVSCVRWTGHAARGEEASWLAAARRGEPWALERFYEAHRTLVYSVCLRLTNRCDDAEDAMQGTFVRAFRELPRFRGESAVKTWVYRIAVNESLSLRRRRRDEPAIEEARLPAADAGAGAPESLAVRLALERVRPEHRVVLVLRFWEGLSGPEIAAVLGISLPAAKMRLTRARREFRRCYEETP